MTGAGALFEKVGFDPPVEADDGYGGKTVGWDEHGAVVRRAHFRYLRGGETVQAERLAGRQPVVVTVRADSATRALGSDWRMRDLVRGTVYAVKEPPRLSDDRLWLEILCESGVAV